MTDSAQFTYLFIPRNYNLCIFKLNSTALNKVWRISGMILPEENRSTWRKSGTTDTVHHKSHMDWNQSWSCMMRGH